MTSSPDTEADAAVQSTRPAPGSTSLLDTPLGDFDRGQPSDRLKIAVFAVIAVFFVLKIVTSARTGLFSDEGYYYQCSERMDLAFAPDTYVITPLLIWIGTHIAGHNLFGVRLMFIVMNLLYSVGIYLLGRPLVGRKNALLAAGLIAILPNTSASSAAFPDTPMVAFNIFSLVALERATRKHSNGWWMVAGLFVGLSLATHIRSVLIPFGMLLYVVLTRNGRSCWRRPGMWLGLLCLLPGFIPFIYLNNRSRMRSALNQFGTRHQEGTGGFEFHPERYLEHIAEQVFILSPIIYITILVVLVVLVRRALRGDDRSAFLSIFSLAVLAPFFLLSATSDSRLTSLHWPMPGYLPLYIFVPIVLRYMMGRRPSRLRRGLIAFIPISGALFMSSILIELASGWPVGVTRFMGTLETFGWGKAGDRAETLFDQVERPAGTLPIVVGDNFVVGGHLALELHGKADIYVLEHIRNYTDGRFIQYWRWNIGERGLSQRTGENALVVINDELLPRGNTRLWMEHVRSFFASLERIDSFRVPIPPDEAKHFTFYLGKGIIKRSGNEREARWRRRSKLDDDPDESNEPGDD